MTDADPELLHQLRGPKDVILDLDFHPKSKQVSLPDLGIDILLLNYNKQDLNIEIYCYTLRAYLIELYGVLN